MTPSRRSPNGTQLTLPHVRNRAVEMDYKNWFLGYYKTRNSSGDEIANVNFLYDDIVHVLQNTIDSCINSATDRRGYVLERMCLPNSVK